MHRQLFLSAEIYQIEVSFAFEFFHILLQNFLCTTSNLGNFSFFAL